MDTCALGADPVRVRAAMDNGDAAYAASRVVVAPPHCLAETWPGRQMGSGACSR